MSGNEVARAESTGRPEPVVDPLLGGGHGTKLEGLVQEAHGR